MVLPVLNGMRHLDTLTGRFGEHAVLGGVCIVATMLDDQGRIVQLADTQELIYGEVTGAASTRMRELDAQMQGAGLKARSSATIVQEMWEKWVFLAALGGITCSDARDRRGDRSRPRRHRSRAAAPVRMRGHRRCLWLPARRRLHHPHQSYRDHPRARPLPPPCIEIGGMREVEVEHILGDLLERARRLGVSAQLLTAAFVHLGIYQQRAAALERTLSRETSTVTGTSTGPPSSPRRSRACSST
jgi:2-dehydropantoate 2-reductase